MKTLVSILSSRQGILVKWAASIAVGMITASLSRIGFDLDAQTTLEVSGVVTVVLSAIVGDCIAKMQSGNIEAIQTAVKVIAPEVRADGHAGAITVAAVQRAADAIKVIKEAGEGGSLAEMVAAKSIENAMKPV